MLSLAEQLIESGELEAVLNSMSEEDLEALLYDWAFWSRPVQQIPEGMGALHAVWMFLAGRGSGKTRTGAEACRDMVEELGPKGRIALIAPTVADVRDVMIQGESGIMSVFPPELKPVYKPSLRKVIFHNGCVAFTYSAEEPNRLRGPQHHWCFVAGTMVRTIAGDRPIETLAPGDLVWTRAGWRPVETHGSRVSDTVTVETDDGRILTGSPDHPVWSGGEWRALGLIQPGDNLEVWNGSATSEAGTTPTSVDEWCTDHGGCGSSITAHSLTASTSTTSTTTLVTTESRTSKPSRPTNIGRRTMPIPDPLNAPVAAVGSTRDEDGPASTATPADSTAGEKCSERLTPAAKVWRSASNAERSSSPALENCAVRRVSTGGEQEVWNIQVQGTPEFLANGILVHNCWLDEISAANNGEEVYDMMKFGLRLGKTPWALLTGTPKRLPWLRALEEDGTTVAVKSSTYDNIANLAPTFVRDVINRYEGTRLGRQELHAEWLDEVEGALWNDVILNEGRMESFDRDDPWTSLNGWLGHVERATTFSGSDLRRAWQTIVAVDPPGSTAECGIVVLAAPVKGKAGRDHCVVLADYSRTGRPEEWGRQVVKAYTEWDCSLALVESNQGGDMTRSTIHAADPTVVVKKISAVASKEARAMPVSALYEKGYVHHVGHMPLLEAQQTTWVPKEGDSPDRIDAVVHGVRYLLPAKPVAKARVRRPTGSVAA